MIGLIVVLVFVDLAAFVVLLVLDLVALLRRQMTTIGRSIVVDFLVNRRLLVLDMCGFTRRQLAGTNSIGNSLLLVELPLVHRGEGCMLWRPVIFRCQHGVVVAR